MKVILARLKDRPVEMEIRDGIIFIDGVPQPIKNITEADLQQFQKDLDAVPASDNPGYEALLNSIRAAFLAKLLGHAVGDDCISQVQHILDHVHYEVLKYLGDDVED